MRRLADGVRRSESGVVLQLGPLADDELTCSLHARAESALSAGLTAAIVTRSEGNPFFAEELLAAAGGGGELPRGLRELLLQRVAGLDQPTQRVLRVAAAAGREVGYALLAGRGRAAGARHARVAAPGRRARRPRRRAGDEQLPFPPCAAGGGDLRDDPPRRARGAARAARRRARTRRRLLQPSSRRTGRRRAQARRRSSPRSRPPARRRQCSAWRRRTLTSSGRWRSGTSCRRGRAREARARRALLLERRARQPDGVGAAGGRACSSGRSSSSARAIAAPRSAPATRVFVATCTKAARTTPPSPRSSTRSSSCRRSRRRRSARRCSGGARKRVDDGLALRGVARVCEEALAVARAVGAAARRSSGRSRSWAVTSSTSAAPRKGSRSSGRFSSSPRRAAIRWSSCARTSLSPTCDDAGATAESRHGWERRGLEVDPSLTAVDSTVLVANYIESLLAVGDWDDG